MKELIIIAGVIVITGTDVFAANLKPLDDGGKSLGNSSLSSSLPTSLSTIEPGSSNLQVTLENQLNFAEPREHFQLIIADFVPPDRGSPDSRDGQSGNSR